VSFASRIASRNSVSPLSLNDWASFFTYGGTSYPFVPGWNTGFKQEDITGEFVSLVQQAYKQNGVVFACMLVRQALFSEARFQFQRMNDGRPGDLFGTADLEKLETPWTNATTGDLLARMIQDVDLAGNFYATDNGRGDGLRRARPDWMSIVLGSNTDPEHAGWQLDAEVAGYIYHPGGRAANNEPIYLLPEHVAHFAPIPDPAARFRGMSWLQTVIPEIMGDSAANQHKLKFFERGGSPAYVVSVPPVQGVNAQVQQETFDRWIQAFQKKYGKGGTAHAYETMFLGGGADVKVVGANLRQIDFAVTQGAGETRIAAAAGVPPVIVGLSEGLSAATYSNYELAMRRLNDLTMRPLWRNAAASLAVLVNVPAGARLWYDDRDIAALREDLRKAGERQQAQATTINLLVTAGYDPDSVVEAVAANDLTLLKHSGMYSVQLQKPGSDAPTDGGGDE
jgi:phage portal protein BeeE